MIVHLLPICMFVVLMLLVFTSYPIGFVLGGISIIFGVIGWMLGVFSLIEFYNFAPRIWFIADNFQIIAVPLFVFMGVMLERSEIAKELLEALQLILRRVPGGNLCGNHGYYWGCRGCDDVDRLAPDVKGGV